MVMQNFFWEGVGGGGVNKVLYGLCESSELYAKINQEHIILQSFNSIGTGVTYSTYPLIRTCI